MTIELRREHDALRIAMRDFARLMGSGGLELLPQVARLRIGFSHLFREHMAREEAMVAALRRGTMTERAAAIVREHGREMQALFMRYSDHIKCWTPAEIEKDWPGYCDGVLALQQGLRERMAWEERHLHPLMDEAVRRAA